MAVLKCKMCGGDIVVNEEKTFGTCDYCGSTMTLPKVSDDQRAARFNRGNHFRRQGDFDKALAVYETIVNEDDADAEAHWCCALCRFGIEYVEDPNTFEYLPTCHRASFDSFLEDPDYLAALEYSDGITKRQYQKDAAKIAAVQRGILATSQNEEPYDVFICYKETDDSTNERTRDSLDAQEIYYQLTQEGYRVFFSRITLEDKVGAEYEPYIFAALNSAKVMIAIGSKPEYFNAVWVKNEWSRFLAMMRNDRSKLLLPCYKDMDPYDLPEQLGVLQSYDMTKIGFIQDLIRGVKKVLVKEEPKATVVKEVSAGGGNAAVLLKRAFMSLEDGEWDKATDFCDKALNIDPENGEAYLYIAMAKTKCNDKDAFAEKYIQNSLSASVNKELKRAAQFDSKMNEWFAELDKKRTEEDKRKQAAKTEAAYNNACYLQEIGRESDLREAVKEFKALNGYKDSSQKAEECQKAYEEKKAEREAREAKERAEREVREAKERAERERLERAKTERFPSMQKIASLMKKKISVNWDYTIGLKDDGTVVAVGNNEDGQCNLGAWNDIVQISAGYRHSLGLKVDGTVVAVGSNSVGQCNTGSWRNIVEIATNSSTSCGLRKDGRVIAVGYGVGYNGNVAAQWNNIVSGSAGDSNDGKINVIHWKNIISIATGGSFVVGLKADGTVVATGDNYFKQCNVSDWYNIIAIAAGEYHTVGLKADGTVVAAGFNGVGQCEVSSWKKVVAIAAGQNYTIGLCANGTVYVTESQDHRYNKHGECNVQNWRDIVAIAAGGTHSVGLKYDGTVVAVGKNEYGQCNISGWKLIRSVEEKYVDACNFQKTGTWDGIRRALGMFSSLKNYKDSPARAKWCYGSLLSGEKATLQRELANLKGMFSGSRRKQIEARLAQIDSELNKLK